MWERKIKETQKTNIPTGRPHTTRTAPTYNQNRTKKKKINIFSLYVDIFYFIYNIVML